ncbi:MAG: rod shape-determining protein MreD [Bryobacteraceae bacterium]|jgi:rod shape-determining protein MreD
MTEYGDRYLVGSQREQVSRFRARVMLFVPLAAILFQVYVPRFDFLGFLGYLELPLLVTIYFALMRRSQIGGLFIGAFIGLAQDSLSIKQPLGMYGIVKTLVGYFAASVGLRIDVEHSVIRLLLTFFFYFFHEFLYWVLARGLLGRQIPFEIQRTLVLGLLNAVVGVTLFHFLDKLREPA